MTEILTADRKMAELIGLARTVAHSKATVLIQGESGVGKELMASLIHENSSRSLKPFVAINCAAIPENLLESELFGFEKGAFTGAISGKAGKFEFANGGTLLLDEVSEMDIKLQAKLLRVIQEGEVDRVGGNRPIPVDVRIIATTNRNLAECVNAGSFREDLYYRLNVVNVTIPPLRDRPADIEVLANHFLSVYASKNSKTLNTITEMGLSILKAHTWPGNVRELENVLERAVLTASENVISERELSITRPKGKMEKTVENALDLSGSSWAPGKTLDDIERSVIIEALRYHSGNRTRTARSLGISIRTLRNKLADYRKIGLYL